MSKALVALKKRQHWIRRILQWLHNTNRDFCVLALRLDYGGYGVLLSFNILKSITCPKITIGELYIMILFMQMGGMK